MCTSNASKPRRAILAVGGSLCVTIALGCGNNGGEGTPPRISNLFLGPTAAFVGERAGSVGVSISLEYVDPDGDLAFVRMSSRPCGQGPVGHMDIAPGGITGGQRGVVWLSTRLRTDCPAGTYAYEFSLFDQKGHPSNVLPASFTLRQ